MQIKPLEKSFVESKESTINKEKIFGFLGRPRLTKNFLGVYVRSIKKNTKKEVKMVTKFFLNLREDNWDWGWDERASQNRVFLFGWEGLLHRNHRPVQYYEGIRGSIIEGP